MARYNEKKKVGGKINSKIDNQDSIAAVLAIEQTNGLDVFNFDCCISDFCIKCEGDEDLEIFNQEDHIYIQVKSSSISKKDFFGILDDFLEIDRNESSTKNFYVLILFENLVVEGKNICDHLDDYIRVLRNEYETEEKKTRVRQEFIDDFKLFKYEQIVDRLRIERRPLFRDSRDTKAIFGRTTRLYYTIRDAGDQIIEDLYENLTEKFAEARRNRAAITKKEIEVIISKELCRNTSFSFLTLMAGYKKIENGYINDEKLNRKRSELNYGFNKARKQLMKGWRKSYRKEFLMSLLLGAKRCPICGHPMMANICGLFGIACPDCGFSPYVTMYTFCECGEFEVIKRQPELKSEFQIKYIKEYMNSCTDSSCKSCGRQRFDEYFEQRIFYAPIPFPYDQLLSDDEMYKNSKY